MRKAWIHLLLLFVFQTLIGNTFRRKKGSELITWELLLEESVTCWWPLFFFSYLLIQKKSNHLCKQSKNLHLQLQWKAMIKLYIYIYICQRLSHWYIIFSKYSKMNWSHKWFKVSKMKLVTLVEGDQMGPFSITTTPRCRRGRYSFPSIAPLYPWLIMLSAKQGGIKYHFLSLWYDSTWDWTPIAWTIGEQSTQ